ncbi:MAG: sulfatase, partial [Planctomycetia bacterium]
MNPILESKLLATRRHLLGSMAGGIGAIAMHELLGATNAAPTPAVMADPMAAKKPPLPAKATRMIVIHLTGSPPHLDLYDNKPELTKRDGQDCPAETIAGKKFAFTTGTPKLLGTRRKWVRCGESG